MHTTNNYKPNRQYKSTLFSKLFGEDKANALSLYNAVNGSNYTNAEDLIYTTLEDVVYMKMKNDVSFLFDRTLNLYEHQSTYNPNMPLRGFLYFADLYRQLIANNEQIYSKNIVKIPTPRYIVFYNGSLSHMQDEVKEIRLSDAFDLPAEEGKFEWTATLVNINQGVNPELLSKCEVLGDYAIFVDKVRRYNTDMPLVNAVDRAVDECVEAGVLEYFLSKHRREVKNMVLTEFDEEKFLKMVREEERIENFMSILSDLGEVPAEIKEQVKSLDRDALKAWTKLAARADSMGEFLERISQQ